MHKVLQWIKYFCFFVWVDVLTLKKQQQPEITFYYFLLKPRITLYNALKTLEILTWIINSF